VHTVKYSQRAINELDEAISWYEGNRNGLRERFKQAVNGKIDLISQFPIDTQNENSTLEKHW